MTDLERQIKNLNEVVGDLGGGVDCPKCLNRGIIYREDKGVPMGFDCSCVKVRNANIYLKNSGLALMANKYTLDAYDHELPWQRYIWNKSIEYVDFGYRSRWFFIGGQVGCGKTYICTAIAVLLLKTGIRTHYMRWRDEIMRLKARTLEADYVSLINELQTVPLLYIDDFFHADGEPSTADIQLAFSIIDERYSKGRLTIISSEWSLEQISERCEDVGSRIEERAGGFIFTISQDKDKNYRINNK